MVPRAPGPLRPATGWQRCACTGGADRLAPRFRGGSPMGLLARSHFVFSFLWGFRSPAGSFRGRLVAAASALLGLEAAGAVVV